MHHIINIWKIISKPGRYYEAIVSGQAGTIVFLLDKVTSLSEFSRQTQFDDGKLTSRCCFKGGGGVSLYIMVVIENTCISSHALNLF